MFFSIFTQVYYLFLSNFAVSSHRWSLASATPPQECSTQTIKFFFLRHNFKSKRGILCYYVLNSRFHFHWPVPPFCLWKSQGPDSLKPFFCLCWMPNKNKTAPVLQLYKHSQIHRKFKRQNPKDYSSRQTQPPSADSVKSCSTNKQKQATFSTAAVPHPTPSPSLPANVNTATKCCKG